MKGTVTKSATITCALHNASSEFRKIVEEQEAVVGHEISQDVGLTFFRPFQ